MKRDVPGAFGLLFLRVVDLVRGRLGGQARPAAIDSGGNLINGDRPRVASELAIGAAQVMTSMAYCPRAAVGQSAGTRGGAEGPGDHIPSGIAGWPSPVRAGPILPCSRTAMASAKGSGCTTHDRSPQRAGPA